MKDYADLLRRLDDRCSLRPIAECSKDRAEARKAIVELQQDAARMRDVLAKIELAARTVASLETCGEWDTLRWIANIAHAAMKESP